MTDQSCALLARPRHTARRTDRIGCKIWLRDHSSPPRLRRVPVPPAYPAEVEPHRRPHTLVCFLAAALILDWAVLLTVLPVPSPPPPRPDAPAGGRYGPLIAAGDAAVLSAQGVLRQCKEENRCAAAQEQLSRLTPSQRRKLGSLGGWDRYHFVGRSYHTDERSGETPGAPAAGRRVRVSDEPLNGVYFRY